MIGSGTHDASSGRPITRIEIAAPEPIRVGIMLTPDRQRFIASALRARLRG